MARPPLPPAPPKNRFFEEDMPPAPLPPKAQSSSPFAKKLFHRTPKQEPVHEDVFRDVVSEKTEVQRERDIFAPIKAVPQRAPLVPKRVRDDEEYDRPEAEEQEDVAPKRRVQEERDLFAPVKKAPQQEFRRTTNREEQIANLLGTPTNKGPPLFIKIDKYREVVNSIHHLKTYALNLRDALDALQDMEKELANGIAITHHALDKFNSTIASLDSKITRIPSSGEDRELEELDNMAKDMTEQVDRIRDELKSIRSQQ